MSKVFVTSSKKQRAFTLIELLVVSTIIIVLSTIGLVSYRQAGLNSRNAKRKADLEIMRQAMMLYKQDTGYYFSSSSRQLAILFLLCFSSLCYFVFFFNYQDKFYP